MSLLTVKQAAERLGVSPALVYNLCAARRIRHERHGLGRGTIKITEEACEEYRRSATVEPSGKPPDRTPAKPRRKPGTYRHLK